MVELFIYLLCIALSLNISILQLKLKKRFGGTNIKKIWDGKKMNPGDLNSPISAISKSFLEKALKMILQQIEKLIKK
jgi:hypothetical protein